MIERTLRLTADQRGIAAAAELLRAGRLVAFPTETVYGLGADALNIAAVAGIFAAKERPAWDPLIVHVAAADELQVVAVVESALRRRVAALAEAFWPGPLTLLLPRSARVPDAVTAGRGQVGVRVPAHPVARALLLEAGVPVAAPSANRFGHTSPTTAAHVLADLDGRIDAVLDGGACSVGVESTVLDPCRSPMLIYRPGAVTAAMIAAIAGAVELYAVGATDRGVDAPEGLPSPGVGLRHYAPRAELVLVADADEMLRAVEQGGAAGAVGVMLPKGWPVPEGATIFVWGEWSDLALLARRLFAGLRELDDRGAAVIVCPLPAERSGMAEALRDRLLKAAKRA